MVSPAGAPAESRSVSPYPPTLASASEPPAAGIGAVVETDAGVGVAVAAVIGVEEDEPLQAVSSAASPSPLRPSEKPRWYRRIEVPTTSDESPTIKHWQAIAFSPSGALEQGVSPSRSDAPPRLGRRCSPWRQRSLPRLRGQHEAPQFTRERGRSRAAGIRSRSLRAFEARAGTLRNRRAAWNTEKPLVETTAAFRSGAQEGTRTPTTLRSLIRESLFFATALAVLGASPHLDRPL